MALLLLLEQQLQILQMLMPIQLLAPLILEFEFHHLVQLEPQGLIMMLLTLEHSPLQQDTICSNLENLEQQLLLL